MDLNDINLPAIYKERLNQELKVIIDNGIQNFMPYFITLADIVAQAKKNGMLVGPARGCLLAENLVFVQNKGFIPIKDVDMGDFVFTHMGRFKPVINRFVYDSMDPLIDIETSFNDFNKLKVTHDHKIRVKRRNNKKEQEILWVPAEDVKLMDYLFYPHFPVSNVGSLKSIDLKELLPKLSNYKYDDDILIQTIQNNLKSPFSLDEMHKRLNGQLSRRTLLDFRNGSVVLKPNTIRILHEYALQNNLSGVEELRKVSCESTYKVIKSPRHVTLDDDFCFLLGVYNAVGGIEINSKKSTLNLGNRWSTQNATVYGLMKKKFGVECRFVKNTSKSFGIINHNSLVVRIFSSLLNVKKKNLKMLPIAEMFDEQQLRKFFAGLMYGFSKGKTNTNSFKIKANDSFVLEIRYLLLKLKILHSIKDVTHVGKYKVYQIDLFFSKKVNFHSDKDGMWVAPVTITQYRKKATVYDLEVLDDHSFLTFNGIVHNSAGGSLTAYLLGITSIDPIRWNLPFSRFLSVSRLKKSVPDIDVDFEVNEKNHLWHRDSINEYIFNKYGDRAAQIATFGMLKLKSSLMDSFRIHLVQPTNIKISRLKEAGQFQEMEALTNWLHNERLEFDNMRKSLGKDPTDITSLEWLQGYTRDEIFYPGLIDTNDHLKKWMVRYPEVIETAKTLMGIPRSIGKHAAGIVIADRSISELCGVMKIDGHNVIAYNKKDVAKLGLIKNDNLGVTCLNFIGDTLRLLAKEGIVLDPWELPEDEAVFDTFMDDRCLTLFQHETLGGARFIKKLVPKCKEDLFASVALNRPGALNAKITLDDGTTMPAADVYLERRAGRLPLQYLHDDLEPILKSTFGVYVYQEQVMASVQLLLNYTEEESDTIRSGISDKKVQAFDEVKKRLPLLKERGWNDAQIADFFQQVIAFSEYSFNKSHSCAYGLVAYTTSYLKYHYPMQWWASVLSHSKSKDVMEKYWVEVNSFVTAPSINSSQDSYVIRGDKIIPPLNLIKGVGENALAELAAKAPYTDLKDLLDRVGKRVVNKGKIVSLITAGALNDLFGPDVSLSEKFKIYFDLKAAAEKKKKTEIEEKHLNLNPYQEYLLAKQVLPISNILLSESIFKTPNINKPFINVTYYTTDHRELNVQALRASLPLVSGKVFNRVLNNMYSYKDNYLDVGCYGYVAMMRKFPYTCKKTGRALQGVELQLDFDSFFYNMVCWPSKTEKSPAVGEFLAEKQAFLLKIRLQRGREDFKIIGVEDITYKKE